MELTSESVLALAPDASSVKAAQALLKPGQWPTLGFNENAVWGECKGSGSKPYQVEADLSGPVFKCTCPSRKFPCKHSLALLLLRVQQEAAFTQGEAPDWVKEWLDAREKRAARQEQKQENKGQPADPAGRSQARGVPPQTHGCPAWTIWSAGCATSYATASGSSPGLPPGRRKPPRAWSTRSFPASPRGCGTCKASRPPGRTGPAWCWPVWAAAAPHRRLPPP